MVDCNLSVTEKSVLKSVLKSWRIWDFKLLSNFLLEIGIQFSQSENEIKKIVDDAERKIEK